MWPTEYWEIIADNLDKAGWSYGYVSALGSARPRDLDRGRAWLRKTLRCAPR